MEFLQEDMVTPEPSQSQHDLTERRDAVREQFAVGFFKLSWLKTLLLLTNSAAHEQLEAGSQERCPSIQYL